MFSQTAEYALRACIYLASRESRNPATAATIAEATKVPFNYLQKLLRMLVGAGILSAQRGNSGGFAMAKVPSAVSVLDVLKAVECPVPRIERCPLGIPGHSRLCTLHRLLDHQLANVEQAFASASLESMMQPDGGIQPICEHIQHTVPIKVRTN